MVWKTYIPANRWMVTKWQRRGRHPKLIHIYWGKEFFDALSETVDSNPLIRIILDTIGSENYRYYPIYSRSLKWYRHKREDTRWIWTYYDKVNRVWDYENNKIDFCLDKVVWWYPPILTWLYTERPESKEHWDLLIYFIKERHASQKKRTPKTTNWRTES